MVTDYSRTLMLLARAYLEGKDVFQDLALTRQGFVVDPRVSGAVHLWLLAQGSDTKRGYGVRLQGALEAAHFNTKVPGSATACLLQLDQVNGLLSAANLVRFAQRKDCAGLALSPPISITSDARSLCSSFTVHNRERPIFAVHETSTSS